MLLLPGNEVKVLLDKEFYRRAEYVTKILMAMKERYGEEAFNIAKQAIYDIGFEKGQHRAQVARENNEEISLENLSSQVTHKISRFYFGTTSDFQGDQIVIRETYCPLPRKWKEMGFSDDEIVEAANDIKVVDATPSPVVEMPEPLPEPLPSPAGL